VLKTTVVALYDSPTVAYHALLSLNRAGVDKQSLGFLVQQDPRVATRQTRNSIVTDAIPSDFDSTLNDLTTLLDEVYTIFAPSVLRISIAGPIFDSMRNMVYTALQKGIDPMPVSLMAVLIDLNVSDDEIATIATDVEDMNVLVVAQVEDSRRGKAISILNAFMPRQLTFGREHEGVRLHDSISAQLEPVLGATDSPPLTLRDARSISTEPSWLPVAH